MRVHVRCTVYSFCFKRVLGVSTKHRRLRLGGVEVPLERLAFRIQVELADVMHVEEALEHRRLPRQRLWKLEFAVCAHSLVSDADDVDPDPRVRDDSVACVLLAPSDFVPG